MMRNMDDKVSTYGNAKMLDQLLRQVAPELVSFIEDAEIEREQHRCGGTQDDVSMPSCLVHPRSASSRSLEGVLKRHLTIESAGTGPDGMLDLVKIILQYSVNTSAPGFLDKLYAAPLPPGILAELILGVLNTNLHVYQVSPVLTLIEKEVTRSMAHMFGLDGPRSGGISVQGGSASNMTSITIARNTLFPETKAHGNGAVKGRLLLYTSDHGHYSIEKAAQALGFGSKNVISVPVDKAGRMDPKCLSRLIAEAKEQGKFPFYINATAGSTVLGSFDPFEEIASIAKQNGMWLHIDGAWGGSFMYSKKPEIKESLRGIGLADSISTNPHKMLGVPVTCSFLLGKDLKQFQQANTLKAGYLFHDEAGAEPSQSKDLNSSTTNPRELNGDDDAWKEPYDLADLTLQCGRRGDALKHWLSWKYYGTQGFSTMIDHASEVACYMYRLVEAEPDLTSVLSGIQPSCLQVCFYYTPGGDFVHGLFDRPGYLKSQASTSDGLSADEMLSRKQELGKLNSNITTRIAKALIVKGFMIDFAPALSGEEDRGSFFRVVVNVSTVRQTVDKLVREILDIGASTIMSPKR